MRVQSLLIALFLLYLGCAQFEEAITNHCPVLYLLNIQPYPDDEEFAGWDRGLDLIPGGHLAAEQINNRSDILMGYELKLIDIDSEACGRKTVTKGLVNLYKELVNPSVNHTCIAGIIGQFCSTVTNFVSPIISHPGIGYVQLAASTAPEHRSDPGFSEIFHTIESSSVFNKAVIAIMKAFDWQRIGLVYDSHGFYFTTTANDFSHRIDSLPDVEVVTHVAIETNSQSITKAFDTINEEEVRISYWSASDDQISFLLCEAYKRNFLWPGHVYIIHEATIESILQTETSCSKEEIVVSLQGVFLLQYRLFVENNTKLFSGWTYSEFRQRYTSRLWKDASARTDLVGESVYANALYDQVWTFALAVNNSLPSVRSQNLSFEDYSIGHTESISKIIMAELSKLSFQGASGRIEFDKSRDIPSFIDIFQVQNGTVKLVGIFDSLTHNISLDTHTRIFENIPSDRFETTYELLPTWLGACIFTVQCIVFCLITTNVIFLLWWRNDEEIKATSPVLSTLMITGCYFLCTASVFHTVYRVIVIKNAALFTFLCNLKVWSSLIGTDLIFATLFLRLLRLFHIFQAFHKTSKYWSDKYMFIYILLICLGKLILLVLWSIVDIFHQKTDQKYIPSATPPRYKAIMYCTSKHRNLWVLFSLFYSGMLMLLVMFIAIQTRNIKMDNFKDTKKINSFLFLSVISVAITVPLEIIFSALGKNTGADISEWLTYFSMATLCQLCLFTPKILPLVVKKAKLGGGKETSHLHPIHVPSEQVTVPYTLMTLD